MQKIFRPQEPWRSGVSVMCMDRKKKSIYWFTIWSKMAHFIKDVSLAEEKSWSALMHWWCWSIYFAYWILSLFTAKKGCLSAFGLFSFGRALSSQLTPYQVYFANCLFQRNPFDFRLLKSQSYPRWQNLFTQNMFSYSYINLKPKSKKSK